MQAAVTSDDTTLGVPVAMQGADPLIAMPGYLPLVAFRTFIAKKSAAVKAAAAGKKGRRR